MWVAIVGSRSIEDCGCDPAAHRQPADLAEGGESCVQMTVYFLILSVLARVASKSGFEGIVSGGAKGVDGLAEFLAKMNGTPVKVYRPQGEKGKTFAERAHQRNARIVKQAAGGLVVAIFDPRKPKSSGTNDTVSIARRAGTEVHEWHGKWLR